MVMNVLCDFDIFVLLMVRKLCVNMLVGVWWFENLSIVG